MKDPDGLLNDGSFAPISKGGFYDSDIDPYEFSDMLVKTRGAADGFTGPFTGPFASLTPCKDMESAEEYTAEMKAGRTNKDT